jgi:predicted metal-dependent hydrolase
VTAFERAEQERVLLRLRRDALILASRFALPLRSLEPERPQVRRRYGICYADGRIRIRLRHVRTRELLKYSSLVDTLCHELAHLRHMNHGLRFQAFYRRILYQARELGIYAPAPRRVLIARAEPSAPTRVPAMTREKRPATPQQLELFSVAASD